MRKNVVQEIHVHSLWLETNGIRDIHDPYRQGESEEYFLKIKGYSDLARK